MLFLNKLVYKLWRQNSQSAVVKEYLDKFKPWMKQNTNIEKYKKGKS